MQDDQEKNIPVARARLEDQIRLTQARLNALKNLQPKAARYEAHSFHDAHVYGPPGCRTS